MNPRLRSFLLAAIVFVAVFDLAWFFQRQNGAHDSEFGGHPDEAAHYVTGLMLHDYAAAGCPGSPLAFAQEYYRHYPKIGLGVWPPGFYVAQAAWEFAFGVQRSSVLLLMAALAAVLAVQLFATLRSEVGSWLAAAGAAALIALPLVIEHYGMVMAEMLTAIFMFGSALAWGRFLDAQRGRDALFFGALAGLAIMTKGTAVALVFMAPLALGLAGRWRLLARPALWCGGALAAVIAGPWTWLFRNYGRDKGGWLEASPSWHFTREAAPYYLGKLGLALGVLLVVLFAVGLLVKSLRPGASRGKWAALASLVVAVLAFQLLMPVGLEARHLIPAIPAALAFALAGLDSIRGAFRHSRGLPEDERTPLALALCSAVLVGGVWLAHRIAPPDPKRWSGFAPIARAVLDDPALRGRPVLVSSDASGEGMFISELAMRDRRPGMVVMRASKEVAAMDWAGRGARTKFKSDEELTEWIAASRIGCIVVDASMDEGKRGPHHDQIIHLCESNSARFWPADSVLVTREGNVRPKPVRLYLVRQPPN